MRSSETRRPSTSKTFAVRLSRSRRSAAFKVGASAMVAAIVRRWWPERMDCVRAQAVSNETSGLLGILQLEQLEVDAAPGQQILMGALLAQHALVEDEDLIHVLDGRQ